MRTLSLCLLVLLAACSGADTSSFPDAAASSPDEGTAVVPDAGEVAGPDAGEAGPDAGIVELPDAGLPPDAGSVELPDAGAPTPDAGTAKLEIGSIEGGPGPSPGFVEGLHFVSLAATGATDAQGRFHRQAGAVVGFSVAGVALASFAPGAVATPFALAGSADCTVTPALERLLVLLESLDADHDPTNGIRLPAFPEDARAPTVALATLTDAQLDALVRRLTGQPPVDADAALHRFITGMDGETWAETGQDTFNASDSAVRSQGVATDGTSLWFSWRLGLQRTDLAYNAGLKNNLAIPWDIALAGGDHIGDIDVWNHILYAPIEDSAHYQKPRVALYDAQSLSYKRKYDMPASLLPEGIPWIAVDGPRAVAYAAAWNPTDSVLVFDLASFSLLRQVPLSTPLGRIQGAKVWKGMFYMHADEAVKSVYKVNLETGTVILMFARAGAGAVEEEGIAFWDRPDGSQMHTLSTNVARNAMELHHWSRTSPPLRDAVCPGG